MKKNLNNFISLVLIAGFIGLSTTQANSEDINDPFENTNRKIFDFNNTLDDNFFKPVAKAWRKIPDIPRKPLSNLATTAKTPISLANAILQLNNESIGNIIAKFLINMTFGLGGMFDVAGTEEFGSIPDVEEDFGQTLATWGMPDGPYVMLPIFGPSSVRDSIGLGVDAVFNPLSFAYRMNNIGLEARLSGPVVRGVTTREKYLDYVDEMKASSLDFYATMRSLYRQKRKKEITGNLEDEKMSSLKALPIDVYADRELAQEVETLIVEETSSVISPDIENITKTEQESVAEVTESNNKIDVAETEPQEAPKISNMMPSSNYPGAKVVTNVSPPRIYNGIMPSSNYPGFSKSRVNLIN